MKPRAMGKVIRLIPTLFFIFNLVAISHAGDSSPMSVNISKPEQKAHVSKIGEPILFQSTVAIQDDYNPVLFIQDPLGSWWPYFTAKATSEDKKKWKIDAVQFGENRDSGLNFKLQVIVLPEHVIDEGVHMGENRIYVEGGEPIKPREFRKIKSRYTTVSNIVKVIRN